jgi:hypothetical protein
VPNYAFEFFAHIDERKRPENFPKAIRVLEQYNGLGSDDQVKELYNERVKLMLSNPGLIVYLDESAIIDTSILAFDQRVFVPWHMITYFHGRVKLLTPPPSPAMQDNMALPDPPPAKGTIN